jgi:hypothetical protein
MPRLLRTIADRLEKNTQPLNRYEGFKGDGAVILRDRRGTAKAEIPNVSEKANGGTLSDDPLAIYTSTGTKQSLPRRRWANLRLDPRRGERTASEVGNIQLRSASKLGSHQVLDGLDGCRLRHMNDGW